MIEFNIDFGEFQNDVVEISKDIQKIGDIFLDEMRLKGDYEVSLSLVDNIEIQSLNNQYRGIDRSTDVLSFPMMDFEELQNILPNNIPLLLGDIILSIPTAKAQALEYGHSFKREVCFLICHSLLHLAGYDHMDNDERMIMESMQSKIMDRSGIIR